MSIKEATAAHVEEILSVIEKTEGVPEMREMSSSADNPFSRLVPELVSENDGVVYIATEDDSLIGMAGARLSRPFYMESGFVCNCLFWWVKGDYRKKGIGKMLIKRVETWGEECGASHCAVFIQEGHSGPARESLADQAYRHSESCFVKEIS